MLSPELFHQPEVEKTKVYSSSFSEKVSPAGKSDGEGREEEEGGGVGEKGGREEGEGGGEDEEKMGVEDEGGEAVDVMMERREAVDEGTTEEGVAWAFAFL